MLILNMAMNIHVTVRFLQLKEFPEIAKSEAVFEASKNDDANTLYSVNYYLCFFILVFKVYCHQ